MSLQRADEHEPEDRRATVLDWLALAALLALGCCAAPTRAAPPAPGSHAAQCAALRS